MAGYIDGFVFPISLARIEEYKAVAQAVGDIYREHGAMEYLEFVGDDMEREGTVSFPGLLTAAEGETIVMGWITYDSRETRDKVNAKIESDPRIADLVVPLMDPEAMIFDASKMAFGGFKPLVRSSGKATDD